MIIAKFLIVIVVSYLLGSIPFGLIIAKRGAKVDVREHGSGKIGATNVLRTAGRKAALLAVGCDLLKGVFAVIIAGVIVGNSVGVVGNYWLGALLAQVVGALAAMAGHNWSIFLKFRGGRGVATFFGGLMALCPPAALFGGEILIISAGLTRYVSLGSILGTIGTYVILIPLTVMNVFPIEFMIYTVIGTVIVLLMHRDNIIRLVTGTERKLGERATPH